MATTDLMEALKLQSCVLQLQPVQQLSQEAGGDPHVADLGDPLWMAIATAPVMVNRAVVRAEALLNKLGQTLETFLLWDTRRPYPEKDPGGVVLGASVVTIAAVGADTISLAGLPAGYQISIGDLVSFDDDNSPASHHLHEFSADGVANGSGVLALTQVRPFIRAGVAAGPVVTLKRPTAEVFLVPGSLQSQPTGANTGAISFTAQQKP